MSTTRSNTLYIPMSMYSGREFCLRPIDNLDRVMPVGGEVTAYSTSEAARLAYLGKYPEGARPNDFAIVSIRISGILSRSMTGMDPTKRTASGVPFLKSNGSAFTLQRDGLAEVVHNPETDLWMKPVEGSR